MGRDLGASAVSSAQHSPFSSARLFDHVSRLLAHQLIPFSKDSLPLIAKLDIAYTDLPPSSVFLNRSPKRTGHNLVSEADPKDLEARFERGQCCSIAD